MLGPSLEIAFVDRLPPVSQLQPVILAAAPIAIAAVAAVVFVVEGVGLLAWAQLPEPRARLLV